MGCIFLTSNPTILRLVWMQIINREWITSSLFGKSKPIHTPGKQEVVLRSQTFLLFRIYVFKGWPRPLAFQGPSLAAIIIAGVRVIFAWNCFLSLADQRRKMVSECLDCSCSRDDRQQFHQYIPSYLDRVSKWIRSTNNVWLPPLPSLATFITYIITPFIAVQVPSITGILHVRRTLSNDGIVLLTKILYLALVLPPCEESK
jgi:hypothetical protein